MPTVFLAGRDPKGNLATALERFSQAEDLWPPLLDSLEEDHVEKLSLKEFEVVISSFIAAVIAYILFRRRF